MAKRPDPRTLIGQDPSIVPMSAQRILRAAQKVESTWIGPNDGEALDADIQEAYTHAYTIIRHLAVRMPREHNSGHPGGSLSAFTFCYLLSLHRNPHTDQPLRMSAGHLSVLGYALQWLLGREGNDARLASPQALITHFRTPDGLPGHIEAGIGDIPFGTGPLGKGVSNALGAAFGLRRQGKPGIVDVLLADGDGQEGQVMEAFRLASHLGLDNLIVHGDFNDIQLSGIPSETMTPDFAALAAAAGWHVIEVQNGNDPAQVRAALRAADAQIGKGKPIFICYYTTMGHGISFMEAGSNSGQRNYHGAPLSDTEAAQALKELPDFDEAITAYEAFRQKCKTTYSSGNPMQTDLPIAWEPPKARAVTAEKGAARKDFAAVHLKTMMQDDERIIVLHADLAGSGGFDVIETDFPDRVINVGVAEANMYMMAAGMRQTGLLPVTYTFAAFGTNEARANARLIDINCGHTRAGVLHDCTHCGLSVGEDGETHQEQNYLNLPFHHTQVWMPADSNQAGAMAERAMELIAEGHTSVYVFSPRSGHPQLTTPDGDVLYEKEYAFRGQMDLVRGNGDTTDQVTILATGITVHAAVAAADTLRNAKDPVHVRVLNVGCIRPLDAAAVVQAALETGHLIVAEDHNSDGGLATQVADVIADFALPCTLRRLGLNHYFPSAGAEDLFFMAGLDTENILNTVLDEVRAEVRGGEDAFVTAVSELAHNLQHSRFRETAQVFAKKLTEEQGYIDALRSYWTQRECPREQLPDNAKLLALLAQKGHAPA
ncbi:hypothetical protein GX553_02925 [Candidatus Peribacteria bacterium]|nr:hypothetical protein [Candidatus Peribacteria bacterium]